jgi:hypothetical protein
MHYYALDLACIYKIPLHVEILLQVEKQEREGGDLWVRLNFH